MTERIEERAFKSLANESSQSVKNDVKKIVISGIAGTFPNTKNINQFCYNLYNRVDMITEKNQRWDIEHPHLPKRAGVLLDLEKFDAGFFGVHYRQAMPMDPMIRLLLEKAIEAIFDAGVHPSELVGTNTGVFIGSSFSETESALCQHDLEEGNWPIPGLTRSMIAHRISYNLKLKGPSFNLDTACSSFSYALESAYRAIKDGKCDRALVGGINLCLLPNVTKHFFRLGVLSHDGKSKVFDIKGNGYVRSETGGVLFLQSAEESRRVYSTLIHIKTNCDGYKARGINFPSTEIQASLINETHEECQLDVNNLSYLEAHGTGTYVGDPEEAAAIDQAICSKREKPLLIGTVKSNLGHSEPSSGFSSVTKVILIMENGIIPPTLHYTEPRKGIEALEQGRLKMVTEVTPLLDNNGLIGINNFGFGGSNAHALLEWNEKEKINKSLPKDNLARLVCVSGRTMESVLNILNDLNSRKMDAEYIRLYHQVFSKNTEGHCYRGYTILSKSGERGRSVKKSFAEKSPLVLVFGNIDNVWKKIAKDFTQLSVFKSTVHKIRQVLMKRESDVDELIFETTKNEDSTMIERVLGVTTIQILLINILKLIDINVNYLIADKFQSFLEDYMKENFTLEETVSHIYKAIFQVKEVSSLQTSRHFKLSRIGAKEKVMILKVGNCSMKVARNTKIFSFGENGNKNFFVSFMEILGSLYNNGTDFDISKLYPEVQYPVSRSTPMISPLIEWHHQQDWLVTKSYQELTLQRNSVVTELEFTDDKWSYMLGHIIDDRTLFPASGYLVLVWKSLSQILEKHYLDMKIVFEDCRFLRAVNIVAGKNFYLLIRIQRCSGKFEVLEGDNLIVYGKIFVCNENEAGKMTSDLEETLIKPSESVMKSKDIYKELHLRGYNYKGEFRKIIEFNNETLSGLIQWNKNLVTFIDNMLQMNILKIDSRMLYVPVSIKRLSIDCNKHKLSVREFNENQVIPAFINNDTNSIISGGIEIRGLRASSITRKRTLDNPVLEKYQFVPNESELAIVDSLRVNMQIVLENSPTIKMKIIEVMSDNTDASALGPVIHDVLSDLPAIQTQVTILTRQDLSFPNINVVNKPLINESDCNLVVGLHLLSSPNLKQQAFSALKSNGYLLSRESLDTDILKFEEDDIDILTIHTTEKEKLILFKKSTPLKISRVLDISDETKFTWLAILKDSIKNKENVLIYCQNKPTSGILGLVNCLRREPGGLNVKCVFIDCDAPLLDPENKFYFKQLRKNMVVNIFKNSKWGTYRHLLLDNNREEMMEHCYVNTSVKGSLSSLKWLEGPLTTSNVNQQTLQNLVHVYYSSLNFKDIMLASGRLNVDSNVKVDRVEHDCVIGLEYAGRTVCGKRVMGMIKGKAIGTMLVADPVMLSEVPENWSLEDAATVPVVYMTVLYAFFMRSKLQRGSSILIHSGAGGVGQAAIHVALCYTCNIFTTVGTQEKREFLKKTFPQLKDSQIGNSRDTSFEALIYRETNGLGVDFVLNSLAEEKLLASVRCLAHGGTFLEIGRFDLANDSSLQLLLLMKEASFHGVSVDPSFGNDNKLKCELNQLLRKSIVEGLVRPISRTVFNENETEQAFRYMTSGKHIGKVLIKLRDEEDETVKPVPKRKLGVSRYLCNGNKSYIIIGGLGGVGLELTDWLVLRGAKKILLNSRRGVCNGYQHYRIKTWKSYGATVRVSTVDVTTEEGCAKLIDESKELGPVEALFNLAVILKDSILENQSEETFETCFEPKAYATMLLDKITRKRCPDLRDFVVFSSVSCGRGNSGQTNYGMANSVMERICERRKADGYPGLAIQWGAIGDVGIVAEMQERQPSIEIGGTLPQQISSCLEVLDIFLKQGSPIVSSMVIASKCDYWDGDNLINTMARLLGIKDLKTISLHATLSELGMDSMTSVEIQQTLEREFQTYLSIQEVRNLTFAKLQEMNDTFKEKANMQLKNESGNTLDVFLRTKVDENTSRIPLIPLSSSTDEQAPVYTLVTLPGVEGLGKTLEPLSENLKVKVMSLQYPYDTPQTTVKELAEYALPHVESIISKTAPFNIMGYSFGALVALELVHALEKLGYQGNLFLIDGAPDMFHKTFSQVTSGEDETLFQTNFFYSMLALHTSEEIAANYKEKLLMAKTLEERLHLIEEITPKDIPYSSKYLKQLISSTYARVCAAKSCNICFKIKSKVVLYKPTDLTTSDLSDDYNLAELCEHSVNVKVFRGNHVTILENTELAEDINKAITDGNQ